MPKMYYVYLFDKHILCLKRRSKSLLDILPIRRNSTSSNIVRDPEWQLIYCVPTKRVYDVENIGREI
jgi:hypothetical protein